MYIHPLLLLHDCLNQGDLLCEHTWLVASSFLEMECGFKGLLLSSR